MKYNEKIGFIVLILLAITGLTQIFDFIVAFHKNEIDTYKQIAFAGLLCAILILLTWDTIKKILYIEAVYIKLVNLKLLKQLEIHTLKGTIDSDQIQKMVKEKQNDDDIALDRLREDVVKLNKKYYASK